jgi:hypothetical protein
VLTEQRKECQDNTRGTRDVVTPMNRHSRLSNWRPQKVLRYFPIGWLRSLSLQCVQSYHDEDKSLDRDSFYGLFDGTLGSLQQLGYHLPEAVLLDPLNQNYQAFVISKESIAQHPM